ncbi:MAG: methylenetetrahydrofolate reductase C-terminal domain-containing protein [Candidatus Altarchaeaceae archaeon]
MIIAKRKPMEKIIENLKNKRKVLVVGCNLCASIHNFGGMKQVNEFVEEIKRNLNIEVVYTSIGRQCDREIVENSLNNLIDECDAIVSLACGAGVQQISEIYNLPVYPANDTFLISIENKKEGKIIESCIGCGDCILDKTGGICPKTRCPKGLLNGPCAGVHDGLCELSTPENKIPCAWIQIVNKLIANNESEKILEIRMP